ncbi:MADF domain [Cinara cedri]|uniref:MADF domain n=1 Tax=Cinara cedri TaxID=506608 RepID=A0A5E4NSI0_9HEMI|nr:MADF domain [Cinara cedri]
MIVAMERKLILELIEEYKSCTCLWRIKDPDYKNKEKKTEAYESLLQLVKTYNKSCTMEDLKRKIANLRTCYLREFRKVHRKTFIKKCGGVYEPTLWYYKSLEFLNDQHQGEDRAQLNRTFPDNSDEDNEAQILVYEDHAGSDDRDSCSTEPDQQPPSATGSLQMVMGGADAHNSVIGGKRPKSRRRKIGRYSALPVDFYEPQIVGGVGGDPAEPPVADYYEGFGRYVANELRQMDRQSVIIAKRLVNEVVYLGQMGMLNVNTRIEQAGKRKASRTPAEYRFDGNESPSSALHTPPPVEFMETS